MRGRPLKGNFIRERSAVALLALSQLRLSPACYYIFLHELLLLRASMSSSNAGSLFEDNKMGVFC